MIAVQAPGVEILSAAPPLWNQFTLSSDHHVAMFFVSVCSSGENMVAPWCP